MLDASHDLTFPMNVNQFFRLDGLWYPHSFKVALGIRATKIHKAIFGRLPMKLRVKTGDRNETAHYPRGILVQAFSELRDQLGADLEPATPYRKVAPSQNLIDYREWQPTNQSGAEAHRWVKVPEDADEAEVRRLTGEKPPEPAHVPLFKPSTCPPLPPRPTLPPRTAAESGITTIIGNKTVTIVPERNPYTGKITTEAELEANHKSATEYFAEVEAREKALEWYDGNGQPVNDAAREAVARGTDPWSDERAIEPDDRDYTAWNKRKAEAKAIASFGR